MQMLPDTHSAGLPFAHAYQSRGRDSLAGELFAEAIPANVLK